MPTDTYQEPLVGRYTSKEMQFLFSDDFKFQTWRRCWIALAESERELGLKDNKGKDRITQEMIAELKAAQTKIDYGVARAKEKEVRHDVMAHIHEYGTHCPTAKGIIHLGATSMYICDNTELIQQREAMGIVKKGLVNVINNMAQIAEQNKALACLGFSHYQPSQPTTIGKRFTLYIQDLLEDLDSVEAIKFRARGIKGTVGTQASFLELFNGDYEKVKKLDQLVAEKLGFEEIYPVTGQTYPRKHDSKFTEALAGIGVSLAKFATDTRLLSNQKCVDEPFQDKQTGSSAMPYKRNPMRCERIGGLSRKLIGLVANFYDTAKSQWLERTLDDSAIRRMDIPQTFLLADALLILANNVTNRNPKVGMRPLTFYPKRIEKLLNEELPFMTTEAILMDLVSQGHDRQKMHEIIKKHSIATGITIKEKGIDNDLFERLGNDLKFPLTQEQLESYLADPNRFTGAADRQTEDFIKDVVMPRLAKYEDLIGKAESEISV